MIKNVSDQKVAVFAWDGGAGEPKTGDAANITAQISKDGGASAATDDTNPAELDSTNHPGIYVFDLTQAETNADLVVITPVSSTEGVVFKPVVAYPTNITATRAGYVDNLSGGAVALEANVQTHCGAALTAYDPPTKAELDNAVSPLALQSSVDDLESRLTADRATKLDNLDAAITTRAPAGEYDTEMARIDQSLSTTESNIRGTDSDTLKSISDQLDTVISDILNLNDISISDIINANLEDNVVLTEWSLGDLLKKMQWMINNKMVIIDTTGVYTLYKNDGTTKAATGTISSDGVTTTRTKPTWS